MDHTDGNAEQGEVTRRLASLRSVGRQGWSDLAPLIYDELRAIAHNQLRGEPSSNPLETTALVHEAYLKLVDQTRVDWQDRAHFFAVASMVMRRILINEANRRNAGKRGDGVAPLPLCEVEDEPASAGSRMTPDLIALNRALERLEAQSERACRVVECRYFGGLSVEETAEALGISSATVKRDWRMAKAWLYRELSCP